MIRHILIGVALLAGLAAPAMAQGRAALSARPSAASTSLPPGVTTLRHGAIVYRPAAADQPMPLLILLHGAGGSAREFKPIAEEAARNGYLVLTPQAKGRTWDLVTALAERRGRRSKAPLEPLFGSDVPRLDDVLAELFAKAKVDPRRIVIGGFSDGASYALSLGLANPGLFTGILALSPGFVVPPPELSLQQRVFITHGSRDRVLAFDNARSIAEQLKGAGVRLRFAPFEGDHQVSRKTFDAGLAYTFALER